MQRKVMRTNQSSSVNGRVVINDHLINVKSIMQVRRETIY